MSKIWFHALSSELVGRFSPNLQRYIVEKREIEDLILVTLPNFQGHIGTLKCPKYGFCALSSEPVNGFRSNSHRYIVGRMEIVD